jgi:hypothetical protein
MSSSLNDPIIHVLDPVTGKPAVWSATGMQVDDQIVRPAPGMAVTVEIKTGRRRIIEYLLSSLLRYRRGDQREVRDNRNMTRPSHATSGGESKSEELLWLI